MRSRPTHSAAAILVVDDSDVNQLAARRMLLDLGYSAVTTACDGREAVAACRRQRFDLILMDCDMPHLNGLEATGQIRCMGLDLPIIAYTAGGIAYGRERCLLAGMDDFLDKPVAPAVFSAMVSHWLHRDGSVPAAAERSPAAAQPPQFDRSVMHIFEGYDALFVQALEVFTRQTAPALALLEDAIRSGDQDKTRFLAHRIRGGAATLGAMLLAHHCGVIEHAPAWDAAWLAGEVQAARCAYELFLAEVRPVLSGHVLPEDG